MPNAYLPGLLQIRPRWTTDLDSGDHPECVTWWQSGNTTTPPTSTDLANIAGLFDTNFAPVWSNVGASAKQYLGCVITDWSSATGLSWDTEGLFTPVNGIHAGNMLPANVAVLISMAVATRYKGGHPRMYLPYISGNIPGTSFDRIDQSYASSSETAMANLGSTMVGGPVLGGQRQVLFRHRSSPALASTLVIQSYTVHALLATQRRRLRRAAHH